jgi:hypothetical protein
LVENLGGGPWILYNPCVPERSNKLLIPFQFFLKRQVTKLQFLGAFFIVVSIAVAKTPDIVDVSYFVDGIHLSM